MMVTLSSRISPYTLSPSRCGPGSTSFAPTIAAAYGVPQALAWNIGTTSSSVVPLLMSNVSRDSDSIACSTVERCEYSTPFGFPVVPEV